MERKGLILVIGQTGSGKSTTLAAMIDHRNKTHMDIFYLLKIQSNLSISIKIVSCLSVKLVLIPNVGIMR